MQDINGRVRVEWLDGLRGIAMILVLFGHLTPWFTPFFIYTSPVKIPLFFAITGYVFNDEKGDVRKFFSKLFTRLVIPWLLLSLIYLCVSAPFKGGISFVTSGVVGVLTGELMWYMPCAIASDIVFFIIRKCTKTSVQELVICVLISVIGYLLGRFGLFDFCMINRAMHVVIYIEMGYLIKRLLSGTAYKRIVCLPTMISIGGLYIILCSISCFILFPDMELDIHKLYYYNIPYCFSLIVIGCTFMFCLGAYIKSFGRLLSFVGRYTLLYYILGGSCTRIVDKVVRMLLRRLSIQSNELINLGVSLIDVVIGCVIAGVLALLLHRYVPFVLGKRKVHGAQ